MSFDKRFFGIYRGLVSDANDPTGKGRVRLVVPQVLGQAITDWADPVGGHIAQTNYPYGTFQTTADQAIGVDTATVITNWVEDDTNKMYLDGTKMYVQETGDYFFQFSAMITKSNASSGTADIWFRKNGTNIPFSNTRVTLAGSGAEITMTVGFILDLDAGDYLELVSSASASNTSLSQSPAGVGPAIPGVIATVNLVGKYKPKPNTPVWVMFEGGDPNFPLWLGAAA